VKRCAALAISALALVGACSGARASARVVVAVAAPPSDLPPAVPPADAIGDHAETGTPARVVLGARRDRANEAFLQFMRAIGRRDLTAFGTMLDVTVYDIDSGETYPRETWIADLDAMLSRVADFFEREVDDAVASLSSLLEPMILAFLGVVIGGLVIAMYLPIFKLGSVV
jgi:hypothetical protein